MGLACLVTVAVMPVALGPIAGAATPHDLALSPATVQFADTTLGTYSLPLNTVTLTNNGGAPDNIDLISGVSFAGTGGNDYAVRPGDCTVSGTAIVLDAGASCQPEVDFVPGALGPRPATVTLKGSADTTGVTTNLQGNGAIGYYQVDSDGDVFNAGDAGFYGDLSNVASLNQPIVDITPTGDNGGYWLVASDGGIFSFGDAAFHGSTGNLQLNKPIVGMAATL